MKFRTLFTFCVVSLGPIVSGSTLSEDEVVRPEDLTVRAGSNRVHCSGLEIKENGAWNVFSTAGLKSKR